MKVIISILAFFAFLSSCSNTARVHIIREGYNVMMEYDSNIKVQLGDTIQVTNYSNYNSYEKRDLWSYSSDIPHDTITNCNGCSYNTIGRKAIVTSLYK